MFFWKDMLARRKRDNKLDPTLIQIAKFKSRLPNNNKRQIIATEQRRPTTKSADKNDRLSVIRSKRSQADDRWPISYKGDSQKKSYNKKDSLSALKRRKRVTFDTAEGENSDFEKLFDKLDVKSSDKKEKRDLSTNQGQATNKKTLVKLSIINGKLEEVLHRSKRTED